MRGRGRLGRGAVTTGGSGATDAADIALNAASTLTWTSNFSTNTVYQAGMSSSADTTPNSAWALKYSANPSVVGDIPAPFENNPFAYGGGDIDAARNRYYIGAGGGHMNGCGSEGFFFHFDTGAWVLTQKSARYAKSLAPDDTVPFQANTPSYDRWKVYRNTDNEWVPASTHLYCGVVYCPSVDKYWHQAYAVFCQDGAGDAGGGAFVDGFSGKFIESSGWDAGTSIYAPNGQTRAQTKDQPGFCAGMSDAYTDCQNFWFPEINRIWRWSTSTQLNEDYQAWRLDPINRSREPAGQRGGGGGPGVDQQGASMGVIIPDPWTPAYKACLSLAQGGPSFTPDLRKFCVYKEVNHIGANPVAGMIQADNDKPSEVSGNARPFWMGDIVPGSKNIAFFCPQSSVWSKVYLLDITNALADPVNGRAHWNTTAITLSNPPTLGGQVYRQLVYHSGKDAFFLFATNGAVYGLKRHSSIT